MRGEFVEAERGRFEGASLFNPTSVGKYGRQIKDSGSENFTAPRTRRRWGCRNYTTIECLLEA